MSAKQMIEQLNDKDQVQSFFMVKDKVVQIGKNGKKYMSLSLSDITGSMDSRIWDNVEKYAKNFETGNFVRVKGVVQVFQNRKQLVVHSIERAQLGDFSLRDILPASKRDPEEMMSELMGFVAEMKNPHVKGLTERVLTEKEMRSKLLTCPAAKTIHHAYLGGLLEHVLSICGVMKFLSNHYPVLDYDLIIFGAIFHDICKVWELDISDGISYTDEGRLIGHLVLGSELVEKTASQMDDFPIPLKNILKHIVLSHHGRLEYGSPKRPKFLEAFVVAAIDDFDSKMNTLELFMEAERKGGTSSWSRYNSHYDRYFFLDVKESMGGAEPENDSFFQDLAKYKAENTEVGSSEEASGGSSSHSESGSEN